MQGEKPSNYTSFIVKKCLLYTYYCFIIHVTPTTFQWNYCRQNSHQMTAHLPIQVHGSHLLALPPNLSEKRWRKTKNLGCFFVATLKMCWGTDIQIFRTEIWSGHQRYWSKFDFVAGLPCNMANKHRDPTGAIPTHFVWVNHPCLSTSRKISCQNWKVKGEGQHEIRPSLDPSILNIEASIKNHSDPMMGCSCPGSSSRDPKALSCGVSEVASSRCLKRFKCWILRNIIRWSGIFKKNNCWYKGLYTWFLNKHCWLNGIYMDLLECRCISFIGIVYLVIWVYRGECNQWEIFGINLPSLSILTPQ